MDPAGKKTALAFHAKDDLPEVRREVLSLLIEEDVGFFAVVRAKKATFEYVRSRNCTDFSYRYHPNELYDYLVRFLFRDRLHQHDRYLIAFARRGKSDRTQALSVALDQARRRFTEKWGIWGRITHFGAGSERPAASARQSVLRPRIPKKETPLNAALLKGHPGI